MHQEFVTNTATALSWTVLNCSYTEIVEMNVRVLSLLVLSCVGREIVRSLVQGLLPNTYKGFTVSKII